jgi:uncharacterized membrane protein
MCAAGGNGRLRRHHQSLAEARRVAAHAEEVNTRGQPRYVEPVLLRPCLPSCCTFDPTLKKPVQSFPLPYQPKMNVLRTKLFHALCAIFDNISLDSYSTEKAIAIIDVVDVLIAINLLDFFWMNVFNEKFDGTFQGVITCLTIGVFNYFFYSRIGKAPRVGATDYLALGAYLLAAMASAIFYIKRGLS